MSCTSHLTTCGFLRQTCQPFTLDYGCAVGIFAMLRQTGGTWVTRWLCSLRGRAAQHECLSRDVHVMRQVRASSRGQGNEGVSSTSTSTDTLLEQANELYGDSIHSLLAPHQLSLLNNHIVLAKGQRYDELNEDGDMLQRFVTVSLGSSLDLGTTTKTIVDLESPSLCEELISRQITQLGALGCHSGEVDTLGNGDWTTGFSYTASTPFFDKDGVYFTFAPSATGSVALLRNTQVDVRDIQEIHAQCTVSEESDGSDGKNVGVDVVQSLQLMCKDATPLVIHSTTRRLTQEESEDDFEAKRAVASYSEFLCKAAAQLGRALRFMNQPAELKMSRLLLLGTNPHMGEVYTKMALAVSHP
eukprot:m.179546 g.179546  ORF g.179546 m.179546 type:complete len:358 (+) comp14642_c1_seq2:104-1177(+)